MWAGGCWRTPVFAATTGSGTRPLPVVAAKTRREVMTDRYRCSCGYLTAPDVSGVDASAICPGCGQPVLDSAITNEFRGLIAPDQFAPTIDAKPDDRTRKPKSTGAPTPPPDLPGYDILGELGRGGMGVVYKARDHALNRVVAVKMILAGAHAAEAERLRFRREAEAVAALQHPGIVQIFHIGEHAGQPYLALEFVDGGNLAQRVAHGDLMPAADAAAAVEQVAHAIQYAHDQGIIHRDLKPANILLTADRGTRPAESKSPKPDASPSSSGSNTPQSSLFKISDFGLAKKVDETIAVGAGTKTGAVLGTPSYIAPEQATGGRTVTCTADVYSLGAILYELLTGRPPFRADTPLETVLQVLNHEPVPPTRLRPKLPRDLETICLKCLQKDPIRRYQTATELADDLGRFRRGEPILARPLPAVVRGLKWAKRHPAISAVAATAAAALLSVVVILAVSAKRLADANEQKEKEAKTAREQKEAADKLRIEAETATATATAANKELVAQVERNRRVLFALQLAQVAGYCGKDPARAARVLDDMNQCPPDLRDFAWRYLRRLCQRDERTFLGHGRPVSALALSPDGHVAATGDDGGWVRLWSPITRAPFAMLIGHAGPVHAAAFSPDGTTLATAGADGTIRIWKMPPQFLELIRAASRILPSTQEEIARLLPGVGFNSTLRPAATIRGFAHAARCVSFSADGKLLAAGGSDKRLAPNQWDGVAKVWNVADLVPNDAVSGALGGPAAVTATAATAGRLAPVRTVGGHFKPVLSVAFSPDGKTLATGGEDAGVQLVPLTGDARPEQLRQHGGPVFAVIFSPDGKTLATADNTADAPGVVLWDLTRRRPAERRKLLGHTFAVRDAAFAPDGQTIATTGSDRDATVRVWDVTTGEEKTRLSGHLGAVNRVAWLTDRKHLLTVSDDRSARVWQTAVRECDSASLDPDEPVRVLAATVSADGRTLLTAAADGTVRAWAIDRLFGDRPEKAELPIRFGSVKPDTEREWKVADLTASADGRRVAAATEQGVVVWDLAEGDGRVRVAVPRWLHREFAVSVRFSPDGGTVYAATGRGLRAWDAAAGNETTTRVMREQAGRLASRTLAVSPDGQTVIVNALRGEVGQLTVITPAGAFHMELPDLFAAELSPDGTTLVAVVRGVGVRMWAVEESDGKPALRPLSEARETVLSAKFGRDGKTVFAVGVNRDVLAIDPLTGQEQVTLSGHTDRIVGLGTLPKDAGLITIGRDGVVKRWRAEPPTRAEGRLWDRPLTRPRAPEVPKGK